MGKSWDQYRLGEPHEAPRRRGLKTFAIVAALMAITILPAMAARGGNGAAGGGKGSHGGNTTSSAGTLSGPASAHVGDTYTITGSGFQSGIGVTLSVGEAGGCCYSVMVGTESDGTFSYSGSVWGSGTYSFKASVPTSKGYQLAASYSFQAT